MSAGFDLTGTWSGYYEQRDTRHPLTAELTQQGERLSGVMRDTDVHQERSLFEAAMEAGLPPGADEQIAGRLRDLISGAHNARIRYETELPRDSVLEGTVYGQTASFIKSYQGVHFSGYRVGDHRIGQTTENHAVHYSGQLSAYGTLIQGQWWIDPVPGPGVRRAEGLFLLRRASNVVQPAE